MNELGYLFLLKMYLLQNNPLKPQMVKEFGVEKELTKKYFWKEIFSNYSKLPLSFSLAFSLYQNMWL